MNTLSSDLVLLVMESGTKGGQRSLFGPAGVAGAVAHCQAAAATSAVLQGRTDGGGIPSLSYETLPPAHSGLPAALAVCTSVYVRRGGNLPPLYAGPYTVLEQGENVFRLQVGEREETVSVDRLKPHTGEEPVQPAAPPKRGRLPCRLPHPPLLPTDFSAEGGPMENGDFIFYFA
jgi:hypothetical protein